MENLIENNEVEKEVNENMLPIDINVNQTLDSEPDDDLADDESGEDSKEEKEPDKKDATPDQKKAEHEAAEKKRKEEWDAKQAEKKAAENKLIAEMNAMSDDDVAGASVKKLGDDCERLTRRNMKMCVTEHIQTLCLDNPEFARKTMHPRKTMMNCFKYVTRLALEYIKKEREDNGDPASGFDMGGDVPDDLCYKWAEDYFNDSDAPEDKNKDEEFVPKPFYGGYTPKSKKKETKKAEAKPAGKSKNDENSADSEQISLI